MKRPRAKRTRWQRNEGTAGDLNHTGDTRDFDEAKRGALRRVEAPGAVSSRRLETQGTVNPVSPRPELGTRVQSCSGRPT